MREKCLPLLPRHGRKNGAGVNESKMSGVIGQWEEKFLASLVSERKKNALQHKAASLVSERKMAGGLGQWEEKLTQS